MVIGKLASRHDTIGAKRFTARVARRAKLNLGFGVRQGGAQSLLADSRKEGRVEGTRVTRQRNMGFARSMASLTLNVQLIPCAGVGSRVRVVVLVDVGLVTDRAARQFL